jgi:transposase
VDRYKVRFMGEIPSTPEALHRLVERLKQNHRRLSFCYEAGPCGYGVHRLLSGLDQELVEALAHKGVAVRGDAG